MKQDKQREEEKRPVLRNKRYLGRITEEEYLRMWNGSPPEEYPKTEKTKPPK